MGIQLKASTRAFMCSKDGQTVDHSTNEQTFREVVNCVRNVSATLPGSVSGQDLIELQKNGAFDYISSNQIPDLEIQTDRTFLHGLEVNRYSFEREVEVEPFAMMVSYPDQFNPDEDKFFKMDTDEVAPLINIGKSISKMINGTGLREAMQLSDNNFIDALGMGISLYSWLGGNAVHDSESMLQFVRDISSFKVSSLTRTTDSSIPKGCYDFNLLFLVVFSTYLRESADWSSLQVICSDGSGIRGVRKLWGRSISIVDPITINLSLLKAKSSGNNSKTKSGSNENDDAVEEKEM